MPKRQYTFRIRKRFKHGTHYSYSQKRCRCDICVAFFGEHILPQEQKNREIRFQENPNYEADIYLRRKHRIVFGHNKKNNNRATLKYAKENKEKRLAHKKLFRAIQSGKIIRPNKCEECKKDCKPQGHHSDYFKPFEVRWLCHQCHKTIHRMEKRDERIQKVA